VKFLLDPDEVLNNHHLGGYRPGRGVRRAVIKDEIIQHFHE
jgi:hypothetical protein